MSQAEVHNKKKIFAVLVAAVICTIFMLIIRTSRTYAAYDGSRLIDNQVFLDANSMNTAQIQQFLTDQGAGLSSRSFVLTCGAPSDTATMNAYAAVSAPCGQTVSASTIIYYASQIYGVNPRVILATMQKEQSLTTAANPTDWQINQAMGYGCPDSGGCGASNFFYQIDNGTWVLRYHYERANGNNTWWNNGSNVCGTATIYRSAGLYSGATVTFKDDNGVSYATYTLANAATASFYCYTPHAYNNPQGLYGLPVMGTVGMYYSGSYNFVLWFERWFGSTTGPDYAWSIESYTYSGGDNFVGVGETETVTLKAKNTGRSTWYNTGDHPVRLGTWEPAGRISTLFGTDRLSNMTPAIVQPNETATFSFTFTPQKTGTYIEGLNLVAENLQWLQWSGLRPTINVVPSYAWQVQSVIYESGTGYMNPGTRQLVTLLVKNVGTATWNKLGPSPVRLATWQPNRKSDVSAYWISQMRVTDSNDLTVPPGATTGFQFYVYMPRSGQFYEKLNLVAEGLTWLNDEGLTLYLEGRSYSWQPLWYSPTTSNVNIQRNTDFGITVKVKNTGTMTWTKTSPYPIKLGTTYPMNRDSAFYTSLWPSRNRSALLIEDSVPPGREGTFIINARTPSTPGPWHENFNLVAEGVTWFNDPKFVIYINVL